MNKLPWDDLRIILAIARSGSLSGAQRALDVSHATVFRRLGNIEARLGVRLFERSRTGYTATTAGDDVAAAAQRVEAEVLEVERRIAGRDLRLSGTLRVTTTDTLLMGLLSPIFGGFQAAHPDIALEVAVSNLLFNLTKREADLAVRPTRTPPETLVGRKIGTIAQAVYVRSEGAPAESENADFGTFDWVGPDERLAYRSLESWMSAKGLDARCRYRVDTLMGMLAAVRDGIGAAVLPCYLCDGGEALTRVGEPISELATDLWLLTHPDLRRTARIRSFMDWVADEVRNYRSRLLGIA